MQEVCFFHDNVSGRVSKYESKLSSPAFDKKKYTGRTRFDVIKRTHNSQKIIHEMIYTNNGLKILCYSVSKQGLLMGFIILCCLQGFFLPQNYISLNNLKRKI